MDKLPKVYVNKINKELNNSQNSSLINDARGLTLDDVFNSSKFVFNHKYVITLNNGKELRSSIISNYDNKILTIDNDVINIDDIKSIREIKK